MTKLDWEPDRSGLNYTAKYRGLTIVAHHDSSPENPFNDCDGHWPMLVANDGYTRGRPIVYDAHSSHHLDHPTDHVDVRVTWLMQKQIAAALGNSVETALREHSMLDEDEITGWCEDAGLITDCLHGCLEEYEGSRKWEKIEEVYELLGIPCLRTTVRGYSQGDWADLLIVATPEAQKALRTQPEGMPDDEWRALLDKDMRSQADLYAAWAFGDVYGYTVRSPDVLDEDGDVVEEGDDLDSCWGFYGADFEESGLEEAAIDIAEYHIRISHKARLTRLRELILHRVPLHKRPAALAEAGRIAA